MVSRTRGVAPLPSRGALARRSMRRFAGCARRGRGGSRRRLQLGACAADVVQIRGIFGQTVVERMADLEASGADKIDALDSLVDSLAVEDSSAQLLDSYPEQFAILAFNLPPAGFVLGKICVFVRLVRHIAERSVLVTLGRLALARSTHSSRPRSFLARASDKAASFLAYEVEALASEGRQLGHLAVGAAAGTQMSLLQAGILLGGFRFFLCHELKRSRFGLFSSDLKFDVTKSE